MFGLLFLWVVIFFCYVFNFLIMFIIFGDVLLVQPYGSMVKWFLYVFLYAGYWFLEVVLHLLLLYFVIFLVVWVVVQRRFYRVVGNPNMWGFVVLDWRHCFITCTILYKVVVYGFSNLNRLEFSDGINLARVMIKYLNSLYAYCSGFPLYGCLFCACILPSFTRFELMGQTVGVIAVVLKLVDLIYFWFIYWVPYLVHLVAMVHKLVDSIYFWFIFWVPYLVHRRMYLGFLYLFLVGNSSS